MLHLFQAQEPSADLNRLWGASSPAFGFSASARSVQTLLPLVARAGVNNTPWGATRGPTVQKISPLVTPAPPTDMDGGTRCPTGRGDPGRYPGRHRRVREVGIKQQVGNSPAPCWGGSSGRQNPSVVGLPSQSGVPELRHQKPRCAEVYATADLNCR